MMPYLFFTIFLAVMGLMNLYVYRRFFRIMHFNINLFGAVLLSILFVLQVAFVFEARTHLFMETPALFYLLSISVGITVILFFLTLLYDLLHTVATKIPYDRSRRRFIKIMFDTTMLILGISYLLKGVLGGLKRPVFNRVDINIDGLPFERFTIAQLTDVHIGRTIRKSFVMECVERINARKPDMVVITGDLVDLSVELIHDALQPLENLQSRFGTYFILGNHEYFHGPEAIVEHIRTLGITPLINENVRIGTAQEQINLVGITDLVSRRFDVYPYDVEAAFDGIDPSIPTVVLAHQPKTTQIVRHKSYDLMLSGHTHGGQIFPFGFLVMIDQPYLAGLYDVDGEKQIFVSRGTGYWGPPVRVLAPSEISLLTLSPSGKRSIT